MLKRYDANYAQDIICIENYTKSRFLGLFFDEDEIGKSYMEQSPDFDLLLPLF